MTPDGHVGHDSLGTGTCLDTNSASISSGNVAAYWNNTAPTSSVFSIGDTGQIGNGNTLAYCWHDVPGLQKFGTYEGNNNADGPIVELGFNPGGMGTIYSGYSQSWLGSLDKERDPDNVVQNNLYADDDAGSKSI